MKKKVLFCIENFQHGGINKALENLLCLYDNDHLDIGLFVVNQESGPYKELFTPFLNYPSDSRLQAYCTYLSKHNGLKKYYLIGIKAWRKLSTRLGRDPFKSRLSKWAKRIEHDSYDCVIAFAEGYITEFVSTIKGHKAAWIHIDYKRYLDYTGNRNEDGIYESFDRIVIPSHFSTKSFEEVYPKLKKRICVVPNMIDTTHIKRLSMQNANMDYIFESYKGVKIVSVGRICNEKRFFEIPAIAKELVAQGVKFKWYIIGDGSAIETNVLKDSIQTNIVSDYVILLGRKDNPYPYIADSDLLVSTSLSETFSYVVFEAKALGTPVICADFGTAPEILNETEGIISPIDGMADVIKNLLSNRAKHEQLKNNLQNYRYDNQIILDRINQIVTNI